MFGTIFHLFEVYLWCSNSFLKLIFCLLALYLRKTGSNLKPVCCRDNLLMSILLKETKNYINGHLDHEQNFSQRPGKQLCTLQQRQIMKKNRGHQARATRAENSDQPSSHRPCSVWGTRLYRKNALHLPQSQSRSTRTPLGCPYKWQPKDTVNLKDQFLFCSSPLWEENKYI